MDNLEVDVDSASLLEGEIDALTIEQASEAFGFGGMVEQEVTVASLMLAAASDNPDDREWAQKEMESLFRIKKKKDKYGLNWSTEGMTDRLGKERSLKALETGLPYLTRRPDLDVEGAEPNMERPHILIEGDNLHALTVLRGSHTEQVDLIYIDPPYNTGKEFTYNDNFIDPDHSYRHSAWLDFMWRRLKVARELLADTGVVMISIDDNEQANLKLLCDDVFGEGNFITQLIWQAGRKNDSRYVSGSHEYILVYAKSRLTLSESGVTWREKKGGIEDVFAKAAQAFTGANGCSIAATAALKKWFKELPKDDPALKNKHYNRVDETGRVYFAGPISWPGGGGPTYDVIHPVTGKPCRVPSPGWRYTEETMRTHIANGIIEFGADETTVPTKRTFLDEVDSAVAESVFYKDGRAASKQLANMLGKGAFDFPKDPLVLARWFKIVAPKDALILDFFAGSGTTGHAVAALNAEDGGTRQCIMVTLDENGICQDVTRKRMEAVLTGKWADGKPHSPLGGSVAFYQASEMARLPEFTGLQSKWDTDLFGVGAAYLSEAVFLAESAYTPLPSIDSDLSVAMKANGDVVAVWGESLVSFGILEALSAIESPEGVSRTVYAADDIKNNAGGLSAFTALGWAVKSYPDGLATGVNRARGQAIATHE